MFLSHSNINTMNFENSFVKHPQNNIGSSSFGLPINKIVGPMTCFRESTLGSFNNVMEDPHCKSYPLPAGLCIASGAKSRLSFSRELPSLDTMIEELVNTIEHVMPAQTQPPMNFVNIGFLGVMDIPKTRQADSGYQVNSFVYSTNARPEVTKVGMTYAQVAKLPPDPNKVMAKFSHCIPAMPSTSTDIPLKKKICLRNGSEKGKSNTAIMKNRIMDSPVMQDEELNKAQPVGHKRGRKGNRGRKRRGRKGKREIGGKGIHMPGDPDSTVWASNHVEASTPLSFKSPRDVPCSIPGPSKMSSPLLSPCSLILAPCTGKFSPLRQDSESSEEPPVPKPLARLRSLSDCSTGSIDSEDSFIVFTSDGVTEDTSNISDSDSSESDDEVDFICPKWKSDSFSSGDSYIPSTKVPESYPPAKRVRFSDDVTVHPLVVWSCAQRLARTGPWEQMARDRVRFANRIAETGSILTPVLNPNHRAVVYAQRFVDL